MATTEPKMITNYDELLNCKNLSPAELQKEIQKVIKYVPNKNKCSFVGNKILYQYQLAQLFKTHRKNKKSLYEIFQNAEDIKKLHEETIKRDRGATNHIVNVFEAWRINNGTIAFFKMCNATFLYKKYNATKVLDMTAGWGGRALGAINLNIEYTGFDTNVELKTGYDAMLANFPGHKIKMIYEDCLAYDFEKLDYDFMLSSPPYEDIEIYEHMKIYSKDKFYLEFLIPYISKARKYNKGFTAVNISPQMYKLLTEKYKYEKCLHTENLKEQKNGKTPDMIYFWK